MASSHYSVPGIAGQVVLITGASSGFGEAVAWRCAELGAKLVLVARRKERLEALAAQLVETYPGTRIHVVAMDVRQVELVGALPEELPEEFKQVSILINNAGLALGTQPVQSNFVDDIRTMLETNVLAVAAFMRAFTPGMVERNKGQVVNVGSTAGHESYAGGSGYCASKHALRAFTSSARDDLAGTDVRVSLISPGAVETEFSVVRFKGDAERAASLYAGYAKLVASDIADSIMYIITRPPHVQINDMVVTSVHQSGAKPAAKPYAAKA
ncbi:hypothetical protein FOA52_015322 [Chlamydomonas sp. UWO 241]|nr:hypothetical protein FOA52_015322 [Chlamydomonas sp. UWO 241]